MRSGSLALATLGTGPVTRISVHGLVPHLRTYVVSGLRVGAGDALISKLHFLSENGGVVAPVFEKKEALLI